LADALERVDWTTQRTRPAFLTWMALSWQARRGVFAQQLQKRRQFFASGSRAEKETLESVLKEVGHPYHEAVWMISLMIAEFETELKWLAKVEKEIKLRGRRRIRSMRTVDNVPHLRRSEGITSLARPNGLG